MNIPCVSLSPDASVESPQNCEGPKKISKDNLQRYLAGDASLNVCALKCGSKWYDRIHRKC